MKTTAVVVTVIAAKVASGSPIANVDKAIHVTVAAAGQTVFFGAANVTAATGFPVATGTSFTFYVGPGDDLYAIVAGTTQAMNVLEMRAS